MPKQPPRQQSKEEFLAEEKAKAEAKWNKRTRTPRPVGRPSQRNLDREAIAEKAKLNAGISGPGFELWTQARWVKEVGAVKQEAVSGAATIKKHLKEYVSRTLVPLHLISASLVQAKPLKDQLAHWYAMSIGTAVLAAKRNSLSVSLPFSMVDALHRTLCSKHIPRALRPTERQRRSWLRKHWGGLTQIAPTARHPLTSLSSHSK